MEQPPFSAEIFVEVARDGFRGSEVGQDIDKPEELDLEFRMLDAPFERLCHPVFLVEKGWPLTLSQFKKVKAPL